MKTIYKILIPILASIIVLASLYASDFLMRDSKLFAPIESKSQLEITRTTYSKSLEV